MDACLLIRERLLELGYGQKELAVAAEVTESYISQLLTRKKSPPAPGRTDIYEKMEIFLKLRPGSLSELVERQRLEEIQKNLSTLSIPLNAGVREFVLFKYSADADQQIEAEFERHPFGPVERLVTQTLMDVTKDAARDALQDEQGIQKLAQLSGRSFEETRVTILDFLDTDVFNLSVEHCKTYLDQLIDSWSIDLTDFSMDVMLNRHFSRRHSRRFRFLEAGTVEDEKGFKDFLRDASLSGDATEKEIAFLKSLRFGARQPTAYYYYRELQSLRDPLHFRILDED